MKNRDEKIAELFDSKARTFSRKMTKERRGKLIDWFWQESGEKDFREPQISMLAVITSLQAERDELRREVKTLQTLATHFQGEVKTIQEELAEQKKNLMRMFRNEKP